ncbi:MAG: hypothetical protein R3F60_26990 [bacterium]
MESGPDAAAEGPTEPCDPLDPAVCTFPWPSSLYLAEDEGRATGYTLRFGAESLPANVQGVRIRPEVFERMDGYEPGVPLMLVVPGLDATDLPDERFIAESITADSPLLWFEDTGAGLRRVPCFAEVDPKERDPQKRLLFVRPAEILKENTRYVVALRGLVDEAGEAVPPSEAFIALRDGTAAGGLARRQARFDRVFADLEAEGFPRESLYIAWDFHTASSDALHGPMLHMRRAGFEATGPDGPELTITDVEEFAAADDGSGRPVDPYIALELRGTMRVPHFMEPWGEGQFGKTGYHFFLGPDGLPAQNGWRDADFWVRIPHSALDGTPHGLVMYGHGQLGRGSQVRAGDKGQVANEGRLIFFACDMVGMSEEEEGAVPSILLDMNLFPWIADRLHQGMLEYMLLTRAMKQRLQAVPAVQERGIVVDPTRVYYSGISQGGIFGATFMSLAPDITRGHLGVPGQHYFTLLGRSRNFLVLFAFLEGAYLPVADQWIALQVTQQLWSQTDPVSHYRHISAEPFEDDPPRSVLLAPAKGDFQVAPLTVEIVARSGLGVALLEHYDDERTVDLVQPVAYPHAGSGIVGWNFGNAWPPPGNTPPDGEDPAGDPHGKPRNDADHNRQMIRFFDTGEIVDVCGGGVCRRAP